MARYVGKTKIIHLQPLLHRGAVAEELLILRDDPPQLPVLLELTLQPNGLSSLEIIFLFVYVHILYLLLSCECYPWSENILPVV